jgi:ABC-2 type transport system ATP-binding protein
LIADPPVLIWDEPTAGLDPAARRFTLDLIRELGRDRTILIATHILSDIDQICDHVGVMHEGRMIFSGSMRDMKQRLRRDDFTLEVEGPLDAIREVAEQANGLPGVGADVSDGRTLQVEVAEEGGRAEALAGVLQLVHDAGLALQTIQSGQNETEHAYLQLLQEDKAHGFRRFDLRLTPQTDAVSGDPAV